MLLERKISPCQIIYSYKAFFPPFPLTGGVQRIVRADEGTENCNVAGIQCFFRRNGADYFVGDKSFMYGRSVSNQRMKLGGLFYVKPILIGGSNFSRIFGTRAYIATVIQFRWNA